MIPTRLLGGTPSYLPCPQSPTRRPQSPTRRPQSLTRRMCRIARRVLRSRSPEWGGCWVPLLSSAEADLGAPWPVALRERHLHCIICKPDSPFPQVPLSPGPPLSSPPGSRSMQLPLAAPQRPPKQRRQVSRLCPSCTCACRARCLGCVPTQGASQHGVAFWMDSW